MDDLGERDQGSLRIRPVGEVGNGDLVVGVRSPNLRSNGFSLVRRILDDRDVATVRDRAKHWLSRTVYGIMALGWNGSTRHWINYERAYLILAAVSTPLVLSVHSIVSADETIAPVGGLTS